MAQSSPCLDGFCTEEKKTQVDQTACLSQIKSINSGANGYTAGEARRQGRAGDNPVGRRHWGFFSRYTGKKVIKRKVKGKTKGLS